MNTGFPSTLWPSTFVRPRTGIETLGLANGTLVAYENEKDGISMLRVQVPSWGETMTEVMVLRLQCLYLWWRGGWGSRVQSAVGERSFSVNMHISLRGRDRHLLFRHFLRLCWKERTSQRCRVILLRHMG